MQAIRCLESSKDKKLSEKDEGHQEGPDIPPAPPALSSSSFTTESSSIRGLGFCNNLI